MSEARWIKRLTRLMHGEEHEAPLDDPQVFCALYERDYLAVYRYLFGISGGAPQDIEDLAAETFLRAWKARRSFRGDSYKATGWLLGIARRLAIDAYRRSRGRMPQEVELDELPQPGPLPEAQMLAGEQQAFLWARVQTLPAAAREMLVLRYLLDWRIGRIAEYLGLSENNVSVTIHRALARLQRDWPEGKD